jgi:hypothetical protein
MADLDAKDGFDITLNKSISSSFLVEKLKTLLSTQRFCSPPVLIIDLDGTLFDNYPRQLAIFRQLQLKYPQIQNMIPEENLFLEPQPYSILSIIQSHLTENDYPQSKTLMQKLTHEFYHLFLSNQYLAQDVSFRGAAAILHAITKMGIHIWYLTGRSQRNMKFGTLNSIKVAGFPLPARNSTVSLIMKPRKNMHDDEFRRIVFNSVPIDRRNSILGYVDNEAELCRIALEFFPSALIVHYHFTQAKKVPFDGLWMDQWL